MIALPPGLWWAPGVNGEGAAVIRKSIAITMLLFLGAFAGPRGCSIRDCFYHPMHDREKPEQPLGPGNPSGPQEPMEPVQDSLPGAAPKSPAPDQSVPAPEGGVRGGGSSASAPHAERPTALASRRSGDAPSVRAYSASRDDEDDGNGDYASDADQDRPRYRDRPSDRGRRANLDLAPDSRVYGSPAWREREPYREPSWIDRRGDRQPSARDRWERRDRRASSQHDDLTPRERRRAGRDRVASYDHDNLTPRERRRADRDRRRGDRYADGSEERHVNRYDRQDRRDSRQACGAQADRHATREEQRRARRACRGG